MSSASGIAELCKKPTLQVNANPVTYFCADPKLLFVDLDVQP